MADSLDTKAPSESAIADETVRVDAAIAKQLLQSDLAAATGASTDRIAKQLLESDFAVQGGRANERVAKQLLQSDLVAATGASTDRIAKQLLDSDIAVQGARANERIAKQLLQSDLAAATGAASNRIAVQLAGLDISDNLRDSLNRTAHLTSSLGDSLQNLRSFQFPEISVPTPERIDLTQSRNLLVDTNTEIAKLSQSTRDLVGIAQQQAELAQSLAESSRLALVEAIQSGKQAKQATRLAAAGIIVTLIIAVGTLYYNYRQSQSAKSELQSAIQTLHEISHEQRTAEDTHSQEEVRALSEILRALRENPTGPNRSPKPLTKRQ